MEDRRAQLPTLPKQWELQSLLPCGTLSGFHLSPAVRTALIDLGDRVSVLDTFLHLRGDRRSEELDKILNSLFKEKQVKKAYLSLYEILLSTRRDGRPISEKLAWIIPDGMLRARSEISDACIGEVESYLSEELGGRWQWVSGSYVTWLPYISLGSANLIRRWRSPRINAVRRSMFRLVKAFDASANAFMPWDKGYRNIVGRAPIQALYQFEPSNLLDGTLREFDNLGFALVNDLRCLHPDAVRLISDKKGREALFGLYRHLKKSQ